jgi:hypothetical protein
MSSEKNTLNLDDWLQRINDKLASIEVEDKIESLKEVDVDIHKEAVKLQEDYCALHKLFIETLRTFQQKIINPFTVVRAKGMVATETEEELCFFATVHFGLRFRDIQLLGAKFFSHNNMTMKFDQTIKQKGQGTNKACLRIIEHSLLLACYANSFGGAAFVFMEGLQTCKRENTLSSFVNNEAARKKAVKMFEETLTWL